MSISIWGRHALVRRVLKLDTPVAERSEAELMAETYRNYRWNFAMNLTDGALFWFGTSFISATTILPLFLSKLTSSPFAIALLAVLGQASWYLPQLFTAGMIERIPRKMPIVAHLGFFTERLPLWILPIAALLSIRSPMLALVLFLGAYAWHGLGAGIVAPAWTDMIARCFPVERRGWYFGFSNFVGTGLGAIGAIFSGWLLERYPFPTNFALTFAVCAVAVALSWIFLSQTREPVQRVPDEILNRTGPSWRKTVRIVREDGNFSRFLWARLVANFGRMGLGFLTVAVIQRWAVTDNVIGIFTALMLVGQTLGNLLAGLVADRYGHKVSLEMGQLISTMAFGIAWLAPNPDWYYVVFLLTGLAQGIVTVSGVLIAMEFSTPMHRPTYIGIANTATGVGNTLAPLLGGLLAILAYGWVFAASTLLGLIGLVMMWKLVREPRRQIEFLNLAD
ncbi:MAG: MFS transporter [Caldilineaceae bacterium]